MQDSGVQAADFDSVDESFNASSATPCRNKSSALGTLYKKNDSIHIGANSSLLGVYDSQ